MPDTPTPAIELPALPEPNFGYGLFTDSKGNRDFVHKGYGISQLQYYARAAVLADRETRGHVALPIDTTKASREAFEALMQEHMPHVSLERLPCSGDYTAVTLARPMWILWKAAEARGMERAAGICEARALSVEQSNTYRGRVTDVGAYASDMLRTCADRIRSIGGAACP